MSDPIRWLADNAPTPGTLEPIRFYCMACSAAPGTPCSSPLAGAELDGFHAPRIALATPEAPR